MKKLLVLLMLVGAVFSMTSCNMMEGAGKDMKNAGDAVKDAAN